MLKALTAAAVEAIVIVLRQPKPSTSKMCCRIGQMIYWCHTDLSSLVLCFTCRTNFRSLYQLMGSLYKSVALCLRDSELRMITVSSQSRAILKRSKQPILPVSTDDSGRASLLASLFEDLIVGSSMTGLFCCRRTSATSCRRSHTAQLRGTLALLVEAAGARTSPLGDIWTSPRNFAPCIAWRAQHPPCISINVLNTTQW